MPLRRGPRGGEVGPTWNPETGQVHLDQAASARCRGPSGRREYRPAMDTRGQGAHPFQSRGSNALAMRGAGPPAAASARHGVRFGHWFLRRPGWRSSRRAKPAWCRVSRRNLPRLGSGRRPGPAERRSRREFAPRYRVGPSRRRAGQDAARVPAWAWRPTGQRRAILELDCAGGFVARR